MKHILIAGAGRSSAFLIKYLLDHSAENEWKITVGDVSMELAGQKTANHPNANPISFDIQNQNQREEEIRKADLVVSMLPPHLHILAARDCIRYKKHLVTASYASEDVKKLNADAKKAGVILLNEMGVDPGIDHMSAMQIVDDLRARGCIIRSFESFTGGLMAPESDDNPWHYKITWNPRNVVLAGREGAKFKHEGEVKYIPYHKVFSRIETIKIPRAGEYEAYANRDSLLYRDLYNLHDVPTVFRGTLRKPGFCKAWDQLIQLGATDDTFVIENSEKMTCRDFTNSFLIFRSQDSMELKLCYHLGIKIDSPTMEKLRWLGLFEETGIGIKNATPAQILQNIIEKKWALTPGDKDMIAMLHRIYYREKDKLFLHLSYFTLAGEPAPLTAMAKTVGLPLAISAKLVLTGKFNRTGVQLPLSKELYDPILKELRNFGIKFNEKIDEVKEVKN